jgi:nitrous oxidase accessory protein
MRAGPILTLITGCLVAGAAPAAAGEIVVSPAGRVRSLAEAVRLASPGERILVRSGTYEEGPIRVDKRLEIVGEGRPIIRGRGDYTIILVTADSVVIRGLVIAHVEPSYVEDRAVIKFDHVRGCVLEDSEIRDGFFGIYAARSEGCRFARNLVSGPHRREGASGNAIHLWNCKHMVLQDNRVSGHRDGLYFEFAVGTLIERNVSTENARYGLHFMFSDSCIYRENQFIRNGAGIAVMYTRRIVVERNRFEDNRGPAAYGLLLKEISDSRLADNVFRANTVGLLLEGGGRNEVRGNRFIDNGWALKLMANSIENRFEGNSFAGNSFDLATNSQSNYSTFTGNWWDRYDGYDLDRDGRGDVPFRPVRLFSLLVMQNDPAMLLLRSFFVDLLDAAERVLPVLTPETLVDAAPLMERPR